MSDNIPFFVITLHDIINVIVLTVIISIFLIVFGIKWIDQKLCKHNGGVSENSSCDAICKKCGKNLGFIGNIQNH